MNTLTHKQIPKKTTSLVVATGMALGVFIFSSTAVAQSFPDTPLQTSAQSPAANILFILDDSGSMEYDYMPDGMDERDFYRKNSNINPLAYNPNRSYEPWKAWDQSTMTGGQSYTAAYSHASKLSTSINLRNSNQIFYVPKTSTVPAGSLTYSNYYQYTISWSSWGGYSIQRCEYGSSSFNKNCTTAASALPSSRTLTDELTNYATWYSYHKTRIKVAKAGVTDSFSQLNANVRVGYDSIWNRSPMDIPVGSDGGIFRGNNKKNWFDKILNADGSNGTPLHGALDRAGRYFQKTDSTGPWGPEAGNAQISCRQNFTILTTDGYWNNNDSFTTAVGNADGTDGTEIVSTKGEKYTYKASRPFKDNFSSTLADVAMYYWKTDLRTLPNNVPASVVDPAFWQHMTTFGISIGLKGTYDPTIDRQAMENGSKTWKNPWKVLNQSGGESWNNESAIRIDDLWHASINGRGTFTAATDPDEFNKSIKNALNNIQKKLASGSNVSTSATSLQTDTRIFHANYYSGTWTGELAAYDISSSGVAQDPNWKASDGIPAYTARKVYTWSGSAGTTFPTTTQSSAMYSGLGMPTTHTSTDLSNYIKGDKSKEEINGGQFRNRTSTLGDVVDSSPTYATDTDTIYIGANDGFLHGFNASTGNELFAYAPQGINYGNLGYLANPNYLHKYFVDGQQSVSSKKITPGKNYLVAALGRGGKGIFVLDVTSPTSFGAANVLWDKTGSVDSDMGYVTGEPIITKGNNGEMLTIVSNGLDSATGSATLFIYNLTTGSVVKKIVLDTGGNGLAPARGWDSDRNGTVDVVYAGDLKGNLWKIDLSSSSTASWGSAFGSSPLFVAKDSFGNTQPITSGLSLSVESFGDRMWILFGTGRYISVSDITSVSIQSIYGVIDSGIKTKRSDLQERKIKLVESNGSTNLKLRAFETYTPLPSGKNGWYIDLGNPYPGERVIERGFMSGRVFVFPSVIPTSDSPCESSGKGFLNAIDAFTGTTVNDNGANFEYFDVGNDGSRTNDSIGTGSNRLPVGSMETSIGMITKPLLVGNQIVYGGSDGGKASVPARLLPARSKRLSWREIR